MNFRLTIFALLGLWISAVSMAGELIGDDYLIQPFSIDFDADGNLYGVEYIASNRLFHITPEGRLSMVAGIQAEAVWDEGDRGGEDGPDPLQANFTGMHDLAVAPDGSIYIADTFNYRVRKLDRATGALVTVAGTGVKGFSGDGGPADRAQLGSVYSLSFSPDSSKLYMADLPNRRIRVLDIESHTISTIAGNGTSGLPEAGAIAKDASLRDPRAVLADKKGNVYILSRGGNTLHRLGVDGRIWLVVNEAGKKGYSGDGGPALAARLRGPKHLALDPDGRILIADTENHVIRRYDPETGLIDLVAGIPGKEGPALNGDPLRSQLARPHGARVRDGWLYIADSNNNRVIRFRY